MTDEAATEKKAKAPRRGVGTVINEAILAGKTNEEALAAALAEFPEAKTNVGTVSWYRNKLRKDGHDVKKARDAKKDNEPAEAETAGAGEQAEADPLG